MRERAAGVEGGMALGVGEPQLGCRPSSKRIQFVCKSRGSLLKIYLSMIVQQQTVKWMRGIFNLHMRAGARENKPCSKCERARVYTIIDIYMRI